MKTTSSAQQAVTVTPSESGQAGATPESGADLSTEIWWTLGHQTGDGHNVTPPPRCGLLTELQ